SMREVTPPNVTSHQFVEKKVAGPLPGTNARDIPAVFLEVVGNLQFIELRCHPEIRKEQDHHRVKHQVKNGPLLQCIGELRQKGHAEPRTGELQNLLRE